MPYTENPATHDMMKIEVIAHPCVCPSLEKSTCHCCVSYPRREKKRGPPRFIDRIFVGAALQQKTNHIHVSLLGRQMKRGRPCFISIVYRSPGLEQEARHFQVSLVTGQM